MLKDKTCAEVRSNHIQKFNFLKEEKVEKAVYFNSFDPNSNHDK